MRGSYKIEIRSKRLIYKFEIKRKITIIRGDSGTGKTTLLNYIGMAVKEKDKNILACKAECKVVSGEHWRLIIKDSVNCILFFEEEEEFLDTKEFAGIVKGSPNYFVIVTRMNLSTLAYSMDEVYEIKNSGKFNSLVPIYKREIKHFSPTIVITEDSNSGHKFFKNLESTHMRCVPAGGKSKIKDLLEEENYTGDRVLIFVDAAAFGPHIDTIQKIIDDSTKVDYFLLAPESFEYLLLSSKIFSCIPGLDEKLKHPEEYIESHQISWESYFYDLIKEITKDSQLSYTKKRLGDCYLKDCCNKPWLSECKFEIHGDKVNIILGEYSSFLDFKRSSKNKSNIKQEGCTNMSAF